jgi:chemotaxis protein methyltransferase CheR
MLQVGNSHEDREFPMTDANFESLSKRIYDLAGISLSPHKKQLVYSRVAKRIRALGLPSFDAYCRVVSDDKSAEVGEFINSITTNLTSFFRENHHFDFLAKHIIPELKEIRKLDKRIRVWSAGCSTGEEPYSIAATINSKLINDNWDIKLLATDLDSNVLEHARRGIYGNDKVENMTDEQRRMLFDRKGPDGDMAAKDSLKKLITFNQLNLMQNWPMSGPFDVIFCRNVMIYFDKPTQKTLFENFYSKLSPSGYLIIGHSESMHGMDKKFKNLGKTMYQKISDGASAHGKG